MYTLPMLKDIGSFVLPLEGLKGTRLTSASGVTYGTVFDRTSYKNVFLSAQVVVQGTLTASKAKTASFAWKLQHSDSTASSAFVDLNGSASGALRSTAAFTLTVGTTGSTANQTNVSGISYGNYRLSSAKKYVRVKLTPTWPSGSTVTVASNVNAVITFGAGQGKQVIVNT